MGDLSALSAGLAALLAGLPALDAHRAGVQDARSAVGARHGRVEGDLAARPCEVEEVDLPTTILELQLQQTACQAALAAGSRVLQPSLLDFLR